MNVWDQGKGTPQLTGVTKSAEKMSKLEIDTIILLLCVYLFPFFSFFFPCFHMLRIYAGSGPIFNKSSWIDRVSILLSSERHEIF